MKVALTFDDGPSVWTSPILDLLAEHRAKATFFVVGQAVAERHGSVMRAAYEGHEIGNHSYEHERLTDLTDAEIRVSLMATSGAIRFATGKSPTLFRAPHFDTDERVTDIARQLKLKHVGCDIDPGDWKTGADQVVETICAEVWTRDRPIVDLHDGLPPDGGLGWPDREQTVKAVSRILNLLPKTEFVTVSQLWA